MYLVLFGQLLKHVRQALILQLRRDFDHAFIVHLVDRIGKVGRFRIFVVRHERGRSLRLQLGGEHCLIPVHHKGFFGAAAPPAGTAHTGYEEFGHAPITVAALFNGDVFDHGIPAAVEQAHTAVEKFAHNQSLGVALFKAAQIHEPG